MPVTEQQKSTAQAIVNIFETGRAAGDYSRVTVIPGDLGHLSYGRAQVSLASGNLGILISDYCAHPSAIHAGTLRPYLDPLLHRDLALDHDLALRASLAIASADPVMHDVQNEFFDRAFWIPAEKHAAATGITTPLGLAIVFDSCIQGGWLSVSNPLIAGHGQPPAIAEQKWLDLYLGARRAFLLNGHPPLPSTACRMDAFATLIAASNWSLALPITIRGVTIPQAP